MGRGRRELRGMAIVVFATQPGLDGWGGKRLTFLTWRLYLFGASSAGGRS